MDTATGSSGTHAACKTALNGFVRTTAVDIDELCPDPFHFFIVLQGGWNRSNARGFNRFDFTRKFYTRVDIFWNTKKRDICSKQMYSQAA